MKLKENPCAFSNSPLDRAGHLRSKPEEIERMLRAGESRFVLFHSTKPFLDPAPDPRDINGVVWFKPGDFAIPPNATVIFLGLEDGNARFAVDMSAVPEAEVPNIVGDGQFADLRMAGPGLPPGDAAILAQAKALMDWHARHKFCANCGSPSRITDAGHRRDCPECKHQHFPRTDPAVIMLAINGEEALLGNGAKWPDHRFSTLAGFVEPGETFEEAVARELYEEVGIRAHTVHYLFSQPWPFPANIMVGCIAEVEGKELTVDQSEVRSARWFGREEMKILLSGQHPEGLVAPGPFAVAHQIIKTWLNGWTP